MAVCCFIVDGKSAFNLSRTTVSIAFSTASSAVRSSPSRNGRDIASTVELSGSHTGAGSSALGSATARSGLTVSASLKSDRVSGAAVAI